jgi:hypothetical protein
MKLYSDIPARRTRQVLGDAFLVLWSILWIWIALRLHDLVMNLATPGQAISDGATDLAGSIDSAGQSVSGVPLVGESLAAPFSGMGDAARAIASAGAAEADAVSKLALFLSVSMAFMAIVLYSVFWIPFRVAFIRRATAARELAHANDDLDLFALRALARQPLTTLVRIDPDPAAAWRRGDARVTRALAELELRSEGLRPPTPQPIAST